MNPISFCTLTAACVRLKWLLLAFFLGPVVHPVWAAHTSEIQMGVAWLTTQVQGDGSLASESTSIALPHQCRAEAAITLTKLSRAPATLLAAVMADGELTSESLARRALVAGLNQSEATDTVTALMGLQEVEGGIGGTEHHQGNALDTALAILAFKAQQGFINSSDSVSRALGFLGQGGTVGGGGWGVHGQSSVYVTALSLLAAQEWHTAYSVGNITLSARDWLLAARVNGAYGSTLDNALALLALATQTADAAVLDPLALALAASQDVDGSWGGDPFLTALALRALWTLDNAPPPATTGGLTGIVVDATSSAQIGGVAVKLIEHPDVTAETDAAGAFSLSGVAPGSYTVILSKVGYESLSATVQVSVGQITSVGTVKLKPATLTATVVGTVKNQSGTGLSGAIVTVGTASTLTDAKGQYVLAGLPPGEASIAVTLSGYVQAVSALVAFEAGKVYSFSPTLYTGSPAATVLRGKVVNAGTALPIAGATVSSGTQTVTTAADGSFSFAGMSTGAFSLSVTASGYNGVSVAGALVAGANDIGNVALTKLAGTSMVSGRVTDAQSGAAVPGASVSAAGATSVSAADGSYTLAGITTSSFDLAASATGYFASTLHVSVTQTGSITVDIPMTRIQASGIGIDSVTLSKANYLPTEVMDAEVVVRNTTEQSADVIVDALVIDGQGSVVMELKANAHGLGDNPPNLPLTVPAGDTTAVALSQLLLRQPPGGYVVLARAYDAAGRTIAEAQASFTIDALPVLGGGVVIDPPLTQASAKTPVHFSGQLTNLGNVPIPAGDLKLTVTVETPDTQSASVAQTVVRTIATGAPLSDMRGVATDAAGNIYTVSAGGGDGRIFQITPSGTATVVAQIPVGYPNYPTLTDVALDAAGNFWVTNSSNGIVWKVDGQGSVTKIVLTTLSSLAGIDIDKGGNLLLTGQSAMGEHCLVKRDVAGVETVLWANGLSGPSAMTWDDSGNLVVTNTRDSTLTKVLPTGEIQRFVSGLNRPEGITRDGAGNFYVANRGDGTIVKVTADGEKSIFASGLSGPVDLKFDQSGNLFVSCGGDHSIRKVTRDGAVSVFARGVAHRPQVMRYDAAGNLFIANNDGTLRKLDTSGVASEVAAGLSNPRGMAIDATATILVSNYGNGTVAKIDAKGISTLISGLVSPWGVATGDGGDILVSEQSGYGALLRFDSSGTPIERIESLLYSPSALVIDGAGNIIVRNAGALTLIGAVGSRVFMKNFHAYTLTPDPAGGAVFATAGFGVYRVRYDGSSDMLKVLPFSPCGIAADRAGNLLIGDHNGRRIYKLDAAGNLTVFAQLGVNPTALVSDRAGAAYFLASDHKLYSISQEGSVSVLSSFYVSPNWDRPSGLGMGADGRPLVWTDTSRIVAVDPSTRSQTILKSGISASGAVTDGSGQLHVTYAGSHELVTYGAAGSEVARLYGFVYPRDVVWDGSQYWFIDSERTYVMASARGSYPVKMGSASMFGLAAGSDGRVMGVLGGSVYRWDQTGYTLVATVPGTTDIEAIAVRADGATSVADYVKSRVVVLSPTYSVIADYAGLIQPQGLAFDAAGRLFVASAASGAVARFDVDAVANSVPTLFSRISSPNWLDFDADGRLWVTTDGNTVRVDANGAATQISATRGLAGIIAGGTSPFAVSNSDNQLLQWNGTSWTPFAAGLATPQGVRALPDGGVAVANYGNGAVVLWRNGTLDTIADSLLYPHDLELSANGQSLLVSGEQNQFHKIGLDGSVADLSIFNLIGNASLYGVRTLSANKVAVVASHVPSHLSSVYELTMNEPVPAPVAGTVIHETIVSAPQILVGEGITKVDFGSWVLPFGGDFKASIARAGLAGEVSGYLHAGSFAKGVLATRASSVPPGTQSTPIQLKVTGADFSSVSRVETALVKPTAYGVWPSGMTADRAGNIYVIDESTLRKVTPDGQSSILASGYNFTKGMAIDSNENLYVTAYSGGFHKLLRFTLEGKATVLVANLGGSSAMAINSHDEIFVGMPGRLLKITQDGATSVVSTAAIPSPVGLSIDGRDNIYVLNSGNVVTQIKPDGGVTALYSKGDGIDHPKFEYEGMAMAADCGENLYLTPSNWQKVAQNGEEHTLVQVVARTGQAVAVLDGNKIHSDLGDMDYIVFDRFGSRILIWTDYSGGRIWQVPVTCGAISVEAHLVAKPGQIFTGMNRPAAAVVPLADGRTEYVWSLRDVPASGVTFGFDTALEGLLLGETRPVMDGGFLLFKNSFSPTDVKVPLDIPLVQVSNLVTLGVAANQPTYGANSTATMTTHLGNANVSVVAGTLEVDVYDAAGVQVGSVTRQGVVLPASGGLDVPGLFPIGTIVPGLYTAKAVLKGDALVLAEATTTFTVAADNPAASATSRLALDKLAYEPFDRVTLSSRVISESANLILENLALALTVADPAGTVVFTRNIPVAQLAAGATVDFISQYGPAGAAPGTYVVIQELKNGTGQVLDTRQAAFEVLSSAQTGAGLTGTLEATPDTVQVGSTVSVAYTLHNAGNADLAGLPLTVAIIDPAAQQVLAEFSQTTDLAVDGAYAGNAAWKAAGQDSVVLVAVLTATLAGKPITLAQDSFVLVKPPIELGISQAVSGHARILALASCEDGRDDGHGGHDGHDRTTRSGYDQGDDHHHGYGRERDNAHSGEGDRCHNDDDHDQAYRCDRSRADAMATLLNGLDVGYHIVTRTEDFESAFRSGRYNVYWLSGKQDKLDNDLAAEVREAIFRGDGFLVDGTHDERNHALDEAAGVNYRGKQGEEGLTVQIDGPWFTPMNLATAGRAATMRLEGGSQQASLVTRKGPVPGIVSHGYGAGQSLSFAFDLVESYSQEPAWAGVLGEGLSHIVPAVSAAPLTGGGYLPILTRIRNLGIATEVRVTTQLPLGSSPVGREPEGTTAETPAGTTVVWQFPLAEEGEQDLLLGLTVPLDTGDYHLTTVIETLDGDVVTPYEEPVEFAFSVRAQSERLSDAVARIQAIGATSHRDRQRRDQALDALQHAQRELAKGDYADAIDALLEAVDLLRGIEGAGATEARQAVDWLLKETEARWYRVEQ